MTMMTMMTMMTLGLGSRQEAGRKQAGSRQEAGRKQLSGWLQAPPTTPETQDTVKSINRRKASIKVYYCLLIGQRAAEDPPLCAHSQVRLRCEMQGSSSSSTEAGRATALLGVGQGEETLCWDRRWASAC